MLIEDIARLPLLELIQGYSSATIDPVEVMSLTLDQVRKVNVDINALYDIQYDASMSAAEASSRRYRDGRPSGQLDGVPVTIKDSVHAVSMRWHHGSCIHGEGVLGSNDAPPAERLKSAGAIIVAKTTMPDFGLSASGVSSFHGIVRNPWGLDWSPGGSSAGAGASLAAGIGMMSVGSDIAGSVRLPAGHCGIAALKPTQGMIAHTPASDVRSAGPMARHAADMETHLRVLGGVSDADRFSVPVVDPSHGFEDARISVYRSFGFGPPVETPVLDVLARVASVIRSLVGEVRAKEAPYDHDAYIPIDETFKLRGWREYSGVEEALRAHAPPELVEWFAEARDWSAARVAQVEAGVARGVAQTSSLFQDSDFLLTPVMPVVNFPADKRGMDPSMPLRHSTFTAVFNQSGHPAISICGGYDGRGLPVGVQLVGRRFDDVRLCRLATALERKLRDACDTAREWPVSPRRSA
ncbi:amidase [Methylorubrum populi]|uniref:amidase family protein n=1 Tax=Methylorubrum TaxID=2282523 RepID=UPI001154B7F0|nr:amidase family protein [Methylorubrum populi]QDI79916.1 amidase [Methylorubrum populi]